MPNIDDTGVEEISADISISPKDIVSKSNLQDQAKPSLGFDMRESANNKHNSHTHSVDVEATLDNGITFQSFINLFYDRAWAGK